MIQIGDLLKSDTVVDFLETYDLRVVYDFDRLNEGQPDTYLVLCDELSLEFKFNSMQSCTTIWVKSPLGEKVQSLVSFPQLASVDEVRKYAASNDLALREGEGWARCDGSEVCHHYEFREGALRMVTIMDRSVVPGGG